MEALLIHSLDIAYIDEHKHFHFAVYSVWGGESHARLEEGIGLWTPRPLIATPIPLQRSVYLPILVQW